MKTIKIKSEGYVFGGSYKPKPNPFYQNEKRYRRVFILTLVFVLGLWIVIYKLAI